MSKVTQVDFAPREMVSYSKETQTPTETVIHTEQKPGEKHTDTDVTFPQLFRNSLAETKCCVYFFRRRGG